MHFTRQSFRMGANEVRYDHTYRPQARKTAEHSHRMQDLQGSSMSECHSGVGPDAGDRADTSDAMKNVQNAEDVGLAAGSVAGMRSTLSLRTTTMCEVEHSYRVRHLLSSSARLPVKHYRPRHLG